MADGTSRESSSISGSDSEFESSMEGEHSERVYEFFWGNQALAI